MRLESDVKIVKNLLEVVLSRKRRSTPEDDLNSSFNARVAATIDDFLSRVLRFIENPGGGSTSLPEDRTVYCKDAYGQYVKVVEEYYRRAIGTSNGVVYGPCEIMLMEDDEKLRSNIYLPMKSDIHIYLGLFRTSRSYNVTNKVELQYNIVLDL